MSARYETKLTPEVREVLERSIITDRALTLPNQLARPLYEAVNKVLLAAGGKWNRSAKAHLFPKDPRVVLGLALKTGGIVDEKKKLQQFFTPESIARNLVETVGVSTDDTVLEPSAGDGALARIIREEGGIVQCIEIDKDLVVKLKAQGFPAVVSDFLQVAPETHLQEYKLPLKYDKVIMNPPFANEQDIQHVEHALKFLSPGGSLGAIMGAGVKFKQTKRAEAFRARVEALGGWFEDLEAGAFDESGTGVSTVMLIIEKFKG